MKKIENLLLLPFLFALYGIYFPSVSLLGIQTGRAAYFVISPSGLSTWFLCYTIILFVLYKVIRLRRHAVNIKWATSHITVTFLLIVAIWWSLEHAQWPRSFFSTTLQDDFAVWASYNRTLVFSALIFSLVQTVFWIYFVVQMVTKRQVVQQ